MDISVVILTCNQAEVTLRCLDSLAPILDGGDCEIIVVDNGSDDGTLDRVRARHPRVRTLRLDENVGVARGRNAGLALASGRHLMILDNDTIAGPDTVRALSAYLDDNPSTGLVAPLLRDPQGRLQASFKPYPGLGVKLRNILLSKSKTSFADKAPLHPFEPFYVIGAAQMFTRRAYDDAGGLDPDIFFGPEDADFCMAIRRLGLRVICHPAMTITHDWQRATTRRLFSRGAVRHAAALLHFWAKHRRLF